MSPSRNQRLTTRVDLVIRILLELTMLVFLVGVVWAFGFLTRMSHVMAESSPELVHMRQPILWLSYLVLAGIAGALLLGVYIVHRTHRHNIFERRTVRLLGLMALSFAISGLASGLMFVYSYSQIRWGMGMAGIDFIALTVAFFAVALLLLFIMSLFRSAVAYREENEMTV